MTDERAAADGGADEAEAACAQRPARRAGLTVERVWTTEGVHPYDEVTWERRDVVMTNWRDGSINFEQRGVEFPDFWSVNAANIVTTKYFRGAVGTPRARVVAAAAHRPGGADLPARPARSTATSPRPADAEVFDHELTWMLLHQVFSFNSPVWFNVGTASPQQVSACFILVRRRLDGLDPRLVQGGGADLQGRLRRRASTCPGSAPRKELLSSGGTASGPVSFMRGADASRRHHQVRRRHPAGGQDGHPRRRPPGRRGVHRAPRRARRTRSARCATPASTWTSAARTSSASSTRTPTTRSGSPTSSCARSRTAATFDLRGRLDGAVIETVDAQELFRKIAQAAWECADPGIQYDDTINDWHTNPETGRITASQPVLASTCTWTTPRATWPR